MKIAKVESFIVNHQLEESFYFSQWQYDTRTICLVKITTEDGTIGWGEGYGPAQLIRSGIDFFAPLLLNRDPLQHENLWQVMHLRSFDYARRGIFLSALSALDVALWDLKGKILQLPVSVLLGGRKREQIRAYATGMYFTKTPDLAKRLASEALSYKNDGFDAIKMKVGLSLKEDVVNVMAVREAIGPDVELMVDANHAYSLREAAQLARAIEQYDISWFEEPISPENYQQYRELRQKTSIPIAGGECEYLCSGFLHLFQNQCVDIAQPDICGAGGLTEVKKIASLAHLFGIDFVPHTWGTGIALNAAVHFLSNLDIVPGRLDEPEPLMEYDRTENPLRDKLVKTHISVKNGRIKVPDKPGLGVSIDEALLQKYLIE